MRRFSCWRTWSTSFRSFETVRRMAVPWLSMVSPSMAEAWPTVRFGPRSVAVSSLGCGFGAGRPGLEIGGNTRSADRYRGGIERRRQAHGADGSANSADFGLPTPDVPFLPSTMGRLQG